MTLETQTEIETGAVNETQPSADNVVEITPPRRRGRPPKNKTEGGANEVPNNAGTTGAKPGPKKRGKAKEFTAEQMGLLAKQIQGLHALGAMVTGIPELQLNPDEAAHLGGAVVAVAKEYDLEITGKTGALIQLAAACAAVYLPRFLMVKARVAQQAQRGLNVVDTQTPDA